MATDGAAARPGSAADPGCASGARRHREDRPLDLGRLRPALHRARQGHLQKERRRCRPDRHGRPEGALPHPDGRPDPDDRQHGRYRAALSEEADRLPVCRGDRRLQRRRRHRRDQGHQDHRRPERQEGRGQRRLGVRVLPERPARQGRPEGIRPQHGEHDRGRCRQRLRRQARRCRGDLGALAHQGQVHRFRPSAGRQLHHARPDHRRDHRQDRLGERAQEGRRGHRQVMERGRRLLSRQSR